jgi:hypothetical protein
MNESEMRCLQLSLPLPLDSVGKYAPLISLLALTFNVMNSGCATIVD